MKERRGFTIVEVMIVIVIMAILLVIGTVLFRGYQSNARDKEREADVAAIQAYLESIYPMEIVNKDGVVLKEAGTYPALPLRTADGTSELEEVFKDLDSASMTPPALDGLRPDRAKSPSVPPAGSPVYKPISGAANRGYTRPNNLTSPSDIGNAYIYAPGPSDTQLCVKQNAASGAHITQNCRRYTIFYKTEIGNTIRKVESKHR